MNSVKLTFVFCVVALAVLHYRSKYMTGGIERGLPNGVNGEVADFPQRQKKITSIQFWEIGRSGGSSNVSENPYAE
jgi:hypothetical protein